MACHTYASSLSLGSLINQVMYYIFNEGKFGYSIIIGAFYKVANQSGEQNNFEWTVVSGLCGLHWSVNNIIEGYFEQVRFFMCNWQPKVPFSRACAIDQRKG